jgi:hypothetical protein
MVVGMNAEELAEAGDGAALRVFNDGSVPGRAGIAARSAIAVSHKPAVGGGSFGSKKISGHHFPV